LRFSGFTAYGWAGAVVECIGGGWGDLV